jgi:putative transposase
MNLASIVRGFKSATTQRIREHDHNEFEWQPRYHDYIVRSQVQLEAIREYIHNNPAKWHEKESGNADISDWMD